MPKRITHRINNFNVGMNPNIYGDGISRMEHFAVGTEQARPYRELIASDLTHGDVQIKNMKKFARGTNSVIYGLSDEVGGTNNARPLMSKWDDSNYRWNGFQAFNETASYAWLLFWYQGYLFGLWKGTHLWRMTTSGTLAGTHAARTYTYYSNAIVHSKDTYAYFGTDNILNRFDGTTISTGLTLPTNFRITSIAEQGEYINVVGFDTQTLKATSYLWDRDSSLSTTTDKYELQQEYPYLNGTLGGVHFIVTLQASRVNFSSNAFFKPRLMIRYLNGSYAKLKDEYLFSAISLFEGSQYIDGDKIYFPASVIFNGESATHYVIFQLDEKGQLTIVQNLGINDSSGTVSTLYDVLRDGDGFFVAGNVDGAWNTTTAFSTTSGQVPFLETCKYRSEDMTESLDFLGATVRFEALPSGASVVLKTRADEATAWTTIATWDTDNATVGSINKQGCTNGISRSKDRQFRIESLGGAVITGFQADFDAIKTQNYG